MKNWVKEIYCKSSQIPIHKLRAYIGIRGHVHIEDITDSYYPVYYLEGFRYHSVQYLINNKHSIINKKAPVVSKA